MTNVLVTGGAGFIGASLVHYLLENTRDTIHIFDNLITGNRQNLPPSDPRVMFYELDVTTLHSDWPKIDNLHTIYHFAANADVRGGQSDRDIDLIQNVFATKNVCDYARHSHAKKVVFSSSATVYGDPEMYPTPESHPTIQTSVYGASKLAGEAYIQAYSEYGDFDSTIFRFVSWIGPRYSHGVIYDFVKKLLQNPHQLVILGDGNQIKSYLDVNDGVRGIYNLSQLDHRTSVFNLGHHDKLSVRDLADIVVDCMSLSPNYVFSGGTRGWIGDSPLVHLDIAKAAKYGWTPTISIPDGICRTCRYLLDRPQHLFR